MNSGKKFENLFKKSVPEYCLYYRLIDPPQSFIKNNTLRFSWKNPCDIFLFDSKNYVFYTLELKSTKQKSFSFEDVNLGKAQTPKMIHYHQILSLEKFDKFDHVISGFIFNFRNEIKGTEKTYFQSISNFNKMISLINKKSFNENDLKENNGIEIIGYKKRINYTWDINSFLLSNIKNFN